VHAGDVGNPRVLDVLAELAPVQAVRGNVDATARGQALPSTLAVPVGDARLYVLHRLADLDFDPAAEGYAVLITGHSHVPLVEKRNGVLYVNPGSAGPRRFRLPIAVGRLHINGCAVDAEIVWLNV
jgi:putative phosphoesterase